MPPPPLRHRAGAVLLLVLGVTACIFLAADASADTPTTVFKPTSVRFVARRTTVNGLAELAKAAAARTANVTRGARVGRTIPRGRPGRAGRLAGGNSQNATAMVTGRGPQRVAAAAMSKNNNNNNNVGSAPTASERQSWRALNAFEQVYAVGNVGNAWRTPPDLGLAVGNGYVMSSVNSAFCIYDAKTGEPLIAPTALTELFGLPPAFMPDGRCNAELVDPITLYDSETRRWFQTVFRGERDPVTCAWTGAFFIEIGVSATSNPLATWSVYSLYSSNDNKRGSPLLPGCEDGCMSDYPMAQLNANALVITVNSFTLVDVAERGVGAEGGDENGGEEAGPQAGVVVYALDKAALARGAKKVGLAEFVETTVGAWDDNELMFTLSPAGSEKKGKGANDNDHGHGHGGKKKGKSDEDSPFLLMSHSLSNAQRLLRFALTGTKALRLATTPAQLQALKKALTLTASPVMLPEPVFEGSGFSFAQPNEGNFPYGQSQGNTEPYGVGGLDARMLSSAVANGRHLGVFHTLVTHEDDGGLYLAVYLVQLDARTGAFLQLDVLTEPGRDVGIPALAVNRQGLGAVVCITAAPYLSVVAYPLSIKPSYGAVGAQQIVLEGKGLADNPNDRWGDYGAATIEPESGVFGVRPSTSIA